MATADPLLYVPALRAKAGEIKGLQRLAPDIANKIKPHLIIPPPKDIDPEKKRQLTKDEIIYGTGRKIAEHWTLSVRLESPLDIRHVVPSTQIGHHILCVETPFQTDSKRCLVRCQISVQGIRC